MSSPDFSKRRFLLGSGGAMLALPFLSSLASSAEHVPKRPKRFISIFGANGQHDANWYPQLGAMDKTMIAAKQWIEDPLKWFHESNTPYREIPLTSISGPISKVIGTEFDPYRERMLLIRGLDAAVLNENTHIATKMLSGFGEASPLRPTIDQVMARSSNVYDKEPWMRSLNLVIDGQSEMKYLPMSVALHNNVISPVVPYSDPYVVFQKMFPTPIDKDTKKSVIDSVSIELKQLIGSHKLSFEDRQKLSGHLDFMRQLELQSSPKVSCGRPDLISLNGENERDAGDILKNYVSLIVAAIRCDLCRVFNLQLAHTQDQRSLSWLTGVASNHHNLTHSADATEPLAKINHWYSLFVIELLKQLEDIEDDVTGNSYLDNSLVFWGNESGVRNLNTGNPHYSNDMQVLLFGGADEQMKMNRFIDYQKPGTKIIMRPDGGVDEDGPDLGRPYNEFLISMMMKMGLTHKEWETNDEPGFGDYRVNYKNQYDFSDRRSPLPGI